MRIINIHTRKIRKSKSEVGQLLNSLASSNDQLWPHEDWSAMKFNKPLQVGAKGGHDPIRYHVISFKPGDSVHFQFRSPKGFKGTHKFEITGSENDLSEIKHVIDMNVSGSDLIRWIFVIRWLHDALIEDCFDKAELNLGFEISKSKWTIWVKFLRRIFKIK